MKRPLFLSIAICFLCLQSVFASAAVYSLIDRGMMPGNVTSAFTVVPPPPGWSFGLFEFANGDTSIPSQGEFLTLPSALVGTPFEGQAGNVAVADGSGGWSFVPFSPGDYFFHSPIINDTPVNASFWFQRTASGMNYSDVPFSPAQLTEFGFPTLNPSPLFDYVFGSSGLSTLTAALIIILTVGVVLVLAHLAFRHIQHAGRSL